MSHSPDTWIDVAEYAIVGIVTLGFFFFMSRS